jgi:hypothetical protein
MTIARLTPGGFAFFPQERMCWPLPGKLIHEDLEWRLRYCDPSELDKRELLKAASIIHAYETLISTDPGNAAFILAALKPLWEECRDKTND